MNEKVHVYLRSQQPTDLVMPFGRFREQGFDQQVIPDVHQYFARLARRFVEAGLFERDPEAVVWNKEHRAWHDQRPEHILDLTYGNGRISVAIHEADPADEAIARKRANIVMADQLVLSPHLFYPYVATALASGPDTIYQSEQLASVVESIKMPITDEERWAGGQFLPDEYSYALDAPRLSDTRATFTKQERQDTAEMLRHIPEIGLAMAVYQSIVLEYLDHLSGEYHDMAFQGFESIEQKRRRGLSLEEAIQELVAERDTAGEMGVSTNDWGNFRGYRNQWASPNVYEEPMIGVNVLVRQGLTEPVDYEALADSITADTFKGAMQLTNRSGSFMQRVTVPSSSRVEPGQRREITFHCPGKAMLLTHLGDGTLLGTIYQQIREHRDEEPIRGYLDTIRQKAA